MVKKPERGKGNGSSTVLIFELAPRMALGGEFLETRPFHDEGREDFGSSRAGRVRRPASDVGVRVGEEKMGRVDSLKDVGEDEVERVHDGLDGKDEGSDWTREGVGEE